MSGQTSIDGYLRVKRHLGARVRRLETPIETPAVGAALEPESPEAFSEERFIRLAEESPGRLIELLRSKAIARLALLTFAAEAAGRIANTALVVGTLLPLLQHPDPVVREGAIYGLEPHLDASIEARDALRSMVRLEPSAGVRGAIEDALSMLD